MEGKFPNMNPKEEYFYDLTERLVKKSLIDKREILEKNIIKGNEKVGTVDYIRQMHKMDGIPPRLERVVAMTQNDILKYLTEKKYKTIFTEGNFPNKYDLFVNKVHQPEDKSTIEIFSEYNPDKPTDDQLECLYELGGGGVYSILNKDTVQNLGPENPIAHTYASHAHDDDPRILSKRHYRNVMFSRERYVAKEVRKYLDENKGERVALIFGANHDFRFDFKRDLALEGFFRQFGERKNEDLPVLNEVSFPQKMNLLYLLRRHSSLLSPLYYKNALKTYLGIAKLEDEKIRYQLRQLKRRAREQKIIERMHNDIDEGEDLFRGKV
jgi:hypothetical protein